MSGSAVLIRGTRRTVDASIASLGLGLLVALAAFLIGWPGHRASLDVRATSAVEDGQIDVTARITPVADDEVRAWFYLSDPDEAEPWKRNVFQSQVIEQHVQGGRTSTFHWQVPADSVRSGVFSVSVWFHDFDGEQWVHLDGGTYGMPPLEFR